MKICGITASRVAAFVALLGTQAAVVTSPAHPESTREVHIEFGQDGASFVSDGELSATRRGKTWRYDYVVRRIPERRCQSAVNNLMEAQRLSEVRSVLLAAHYVNYCEDKHILGCKGVRDRRTCRKALAELEERKEIALKSVTLASLESDLTRPPFTTFDEEVARCHILESDLRTIIDSTNSQLRITESDLEYADQRNDVLRSENADVRSKNKEYEDIFGFIEQTSELDSAMALVADPNGNAVATRRVEGRKFGGFLVGSTQGMEAESTGCPAPIITGQDWPNVGIRFQYLDRDRNGLKISSINRGTDAAAKLSVGDEILQVGNTEIGKETAPAIGRLISAQLVLFEYAKLKVKRDGEEVTVFVCAAAT